MCGDKEYPRHKRIEPHTVLSKDASPAALFVCCEDKKPSYKHYREAGAKQNHHPDNTTSAPTIAQIDLSPPVLQTFFFHISRLPYHFCLKHSACRLSRIFRYIIRGAVFWIGRRDLHCNFAG